MASILGESTVTSHNSSTITYLTYYPAHELLSIEFKRGGVYTYHPVSEGLYQQLVGAESIGRACDQLLKKGGIGFQAGEAEEYPL
jgi:hypothetical protein